MTETMVCRSQFLKRGNVSIENTAFWAKLSSWIRMKNTRARAYLIPNCELSVGDARLFVRNLNASLFRSIMLEWPNPTKRNCWNR